MKLIANLIARLIGAMRPDPPPRRPVHPRHSAPRIPLDAYLGSVGSPFGPSSGDPGERGAGRFEASSLDARSDAQAAAQRTAMHRRRLDRARGEERP